MSVTVVGEALVDVLLDAGGDLHSPGGSPANVAVGLGRLGHDVTLLTALGDDAHGRLVREHLEASHVTVHAAPLRSTSTAVATLDAQRVATYDFEIAWDIRGLTPDLATGWLHVGSIGATLLPGAQQVSALAERHQGVISYDPNIRPLLMSDADRPRIGALIHRAHVVKLSEEDAAWLLPGVPPSHVARRLAEAGPRLVVVTLGAEGSVAVHDGEVLHCPPAEGGAVVDTVGAGDAFMAGLIDVLSRDLDDVEAALTQASVVARRTCERVGADPPWKEPVS